MFDMHSKAIDIRNPDLIEILSIAIADSMTGGSDDGDRPYLGGTTRDCLKSFGQKRAP